LGADGTIEISDNLARVEAASTGFNLAANITLRGTPGDGLSNPVILKDGVICSDCYNFTALTAETVVFNVTGWTSYSIGRNEPPVVTLISPEDGSTTTNRKPTFNWSGYDAEGDSISYEFNISLINGAGSGCVDSLDRGVLLSDESYTLPSELKCFYENGGVYGNYYNWSVRANDSDGYGEWTSRLINVTALVAVTMDVSEIDFGSLSLNASVNTTSGYEPFVVENIGNSLANISVSADSLWATEPTASKYFQFKADNYTGHEGAFYWGSSITEWANMSTSNQICVVDLNYTDFNKTEVDILAWVPLGEPIAPKSFSVNFIAELSEGI
jgi:hypothetical protein